MDIAAAIGDLLERLSVGTVGTNIFIGQLPAETNGVYVVRSAGSLNNYLPIVESVLDVYSQNTSSATAIQKMEEVKNALHRHLETTISGAFIYSVLVIGDVQDLGRDEDYGKIYKITVQVQHRDTNLIS